VREKPEHWVVCAIGMMWAQVEKTMAWLEPVGKTGC